MDDKCSVKTEGLFPCSLLAESVTFVNSEQMMTGIGLLQTFKKGTARKERRDFVFLSPTKSYQKHNLIFRFCPFCGTGLE